MTAAKRITRRLRRLVTDARREGVALVADASGVGAIRVMLLSDLNADDLRDIGEAVRLHGGCGSEPMTGLVTGTERSNDYFVPSSKRRRG
jgi:hypothetical protein